MIIPLLLSLTLLTGPALAADRPAYAPQRLALVRQMTAVQAAPNGQEAFFAAKLGRP